MGGKKRFTPDQIIGKVGEAEVLLSKGSSVTEACRKIGVTLSLAAPGEELHRVFQLGNDDELLNREVFTTLTEAKALIEM